MTDRGQKREWNNSGGRFCAKGLSLFVAAEALTFFLALPCRCPFFAQEAKAGRRIGEGRAKQPRTFLLSAPEFRKTGGVGLCIWH